MREEELDISFKIIIVGNGAVGKSSMLQRYCKGTFTKEYKRTIGVDFLERKFRYNGENICLMLWDTPGQEEFNAITKTYYRGAQGCILTFSTTDRDSFEAVHSWKLKVEDECGDIPTILVQNKIDLIKECVIDTKEADLLSRALGAKLIQTSVKDNVNISNAFRYLTSLCLTELRLQEEQESYPMLDNRVYPFTENAFESPTVIPSRNDINNSNRIILHSKNQKYSKKKNIKLIC